MNKGKIAAACLLCSALLMLSACAETKAATNSDWDAAEATHITMSGSTSISDTGEAVSSMGMGGGPGGMGGGPGGMGGAFSGDGGTPPDGGFARGERPEGGGMPSGQAPADRTGAAPETAQGT